MSYIPPPPPSLRPPPQPNQSKLPTNIVYKKVMPAGGVVIAYKDDSNIYRVRFIKTSGEAVDMKYETFFTFYSEIKSTIDLHKQEGSVATDIMKI